MKTKMHLDRNGRIQYERSQDVNPILDLNKYEANNDAGAKTRFGVKAASIPNIVIEQWMREGIDVFNYGRCPVTTKRIKDKLNSNEFKYLRTNTGKL